MNFLRQLERGSRNVTRDKVNLFLETKRFHQPDIIFRIVVHHRHHLAMLEPFDLDAIAVKWTESFRPDNLIQATLARPLEHALEKRVGYLLIIDALEQIKLCDMRSVISIERFILHCTNPPDHFSIPAGDKTLAIRMFVEWMLARIDHDFDVAQNGWNPLRNIFIYLEWKFDEFIDRFFVLYI